MKATRTVKWETKDGRQAEVIITKKSDAWDIQKIKGRTQKMNAALELYPHGRIVILAGEGTEGNFSTYHGKRTERAIKSRLTRERCSGDRWAHAYIYIHTNDGGDVYAGLDIDNERHLSDSDID